MFNALHAAISSDRELKQHLIRALRCCAASGYRQFQATGRKVAEELVQTLLSRSSRAE